MSNATSILERLQRGDLLMKDVEGLYRWISGDWVEARTVMQLLDMGVLQHLDTDLFGDKSHGQTIGLAQQGGAGTASPAQPA